MSEGFGRQIFRALWWRDTSSAVRPFSNQVGNRFVICCETQITTPIVLHRGSRLSPSRKLICKMQNILPSGRDLFGVRGCIHRHRISTPVWSHNIISCVNLSIISCSVCRCAGVLCIEEVSVEHFQVLRSENTCGLSVCRSTSLVVCRLKHNLMASSLPFIPKTPDFTICRFCLFIVETRSMSTTSGSEDSLLTQMPSYSGASYSAPARIRPSWACSSSQSRLSTKRELLFLF